jgi:hypothetical protein
MTTTTTDVKGYELESAKAAELKLVIQRMAESENEEREKLSKRYTSVDDKEARDYDRGYVNGFRDGEQKGIAEGIDIGLKQSAKEEEEKEEKKEGEESD